jgi:F-type H+-transporting ATPase subunit delta
MIERTIARRYAKALLEVAVGEQRVRPTEEELSTVSDLFGEAPAFRELLTSPVIMRARRKAETAKALAGRVSPTVIGFLQVLIEEGRAELLPAIEELFSGLADAQEWIVRVGVRSARALPAEQVERLRAAIGRFTQGRRVDIEATVDPSLLGGVVVTAADRVMDGSLAGWLKRTRDRLVRRTE